jgi:hypothetical protein
MYTGKYSIESCTVSQVNFVFVFAHKFTYKFEQYTQRRGIALLHVVRNGRRAGLLTFVYAQWQCAST